MTHDHTVALNPDHHNNSTSTEAVMCFCTTIDPDALTIEAGQAEPSAVMEIQGLSH